MAQHDQAGIDVVRGIAHLRHGLDGRLSFTVAPIFSMLFLLRAFIASVSSTTNAWNSSFDWKPSCIG